MGEAEVPKGRELGKIGETAQQYCLNILKSKNVSRKEAKKKRGNMRIQGTEGRRFGPPPPLLQSIIPIDLSGELHIYWTACMRNTVDLF